MDDNKLFLEEIAKSKKVGRPTDELALMWLNLVNRILIKPSYKQFANQGDYVQEAILNLCKNGLKFDEQKSQNPYAYFHTVIVGSFCQVNARENRQRKIRELQ